MVAKRDVVRGLILCAASAAVLVDLAWIFAWARIVPLPPARDFLLVFPFNPVHGVSSSIAPYFHWVTSITGIVAGAVAIALTLRRNVSRDALDVSAALAAGSVSGAWLYFARAFEMPRVAAHLDQAWAVGADALAFALAGAGMAWLARFLVNYPAQVSLSDLGNERLRQHAAPQGPGALARARRKLLQMQDRLRWLRRFNDPLRAAARTHRLFRAFRLPWAAVIMAVVCALLALAWRLFAAQRMVFPILALGTMVPLLACGGMLLTYRHGLAEHRRKIEWIFWGIALGPWLAMAGPVAAIFVGLTAAMGWPWPASDVGSIDSVVRTSFALGPPLTALFFVLGVAFSIFYAGAIDAGLALRRTTIYALLAVLLTTVFVALEGIASAGVVTGLGLSTQGGALLAGSAVALLFNPLRHRVEAGVQRLVNRLRPAELLAEGRRYVAAVMFSDLSGYTSLSAHDEKAALTVAALFHKEARRAAETNRGRLVKTIGDAALTVYPDSAAALTALARLHERFRLGAELLELPLLPIHSGLHCGELVEAPDGDVFGATVNLAARLEGQAQAGQAVLSEAAALAARAAHIALQPLGERRLKNVDAPVLCSLWMPATVSPLPAPTDGVPVKNIEVEINTNPQNVRSP
jgi:class 3 adenylate cyclase